MYVELRPDLQLPPGPMEGATGEGNQFQLLAIGDSIIAGVGASELSKALVGQTAEALAASLNCRISWQAIGCSGYDASDILEHLVPKLPGQAFDFVIVSVGVNDITGLTRVRTWKRNLSKLLRELNNHSPQARIAIAGSPPMHRFPLLPQPLRATFGMRARTLDKATREVIAAHQQSVHVPLDFEPGPEQFSDDGYHPSEESYVAFGQHMAECLVPVGKPNRVIHGASKR